MQQKANYHTRRDTRLAFYFNNRYDENPSYELHRQRILMLSRFIDHIEREKGFTGEIADEDMEFMVREKEL